MTSHDTEKLDFNKLRKELDIAVEQDKTYWVKNDAKIRAVSSQRVASYDEFKDMVAAAHLKPLNRGDHINNITEKIIHPWNPSARGRTENHSVATELNIIPQKVDMLIPKTGQEFIRTWRRYHVSTDLRYDYLLHCGAHHLSTLFKLEVISGLLGEIITAFVNFKMEDTTAVVDILDVIRSSSRFSLSISFLSKGEIKVCAELFYRLQHAVTVLSSVCCCKDLVSELASAYKMPGQ